MTTATSRMTIPCSWFRRELCRKLDRELVPKLVRSSRKHPHIWLWTVALSVKLVMGEYFASGNNSWITLLNRQ